MLQLYNHHLLLDGKLRNIDRKYTKLDDTDNIISLR